MPRRPRVHVPGGHYHVTLRGNHQHALFARLSDRDRLDDLVAEAADRYRAVLHAYCWMTNHLHLLVQVSEEPLARTMQRIATRYARYFQRSFGTTGHLFERRYHALLVDRDSYLLELVRYIHLNPVRAGLVAHAGDYPWSSHRAYLGSVAQTWIRPDRILEMFDADPRRARDAYERFVAAGEAARLSFPVDFAPDGRRLARPPAPGIESGIVLRGDSPASLGDLIDAVCTEEGCSPEQLASPSRDARLVRIRARIAGEATTLGLASMTEIARRFNRTPACVSWTLRRGQREPKGVT